MSNVAEAYRCDQCGKSFPTEGDVRQHTESMHGSSGATGYQQTEGEVKDEEPMPMPPGRTSSE
ncbi:MAG: hypothetical protein AUH85_00045 [Chloroflexi bacterium 13_1_40CM_4_68_4]|nr:MAG: hypothetical protein AUH85_00045 [Chloroflexi bacterium 13_1_40CM_4_68_4]